MEEEKQDNFEKQKELLKEVLRRAKKKERQEYDEISDRHDAIIDRMQEIYSEQEQLSERNRRNVYPKTVDTKYTLKSTEQQHLIGRIRVFSFCLFWAMMAFQKILCM